MENYETIIFCSFLLAESKFEDGFHLSAQDHCKKTAKNSQKLGKNIYFLCYFLVVTIENGLQIQIQYDFVSEFVKMEIAVQNTEHKNRKGSKKRINVEKYMPIVYCSNELSYRAEFWTQTYEYSVLISNLVIFFIFGEWGRR